VTDDIAQAAALAVELVNTRSRPARPADTLDAFLAAHGGDPDSWRALRDDLLRVWVDGDAAALNRWLGPPQLARAGSTWELRPTGSPAAYGLAALIAEHGLSRLGFCAASDCQCVYADTSPRGTRRYCSRTCATRTNVRRHRATAA
jgi:predicted RNA-binding Zn ribbon-like protein